MKKKIYHVLPVVILLILQIYSISKINRLQNIVNNFEVSFNNSIGVVQHSINDIYSNTNAIMEKKASIIADCSMNILDLNKETFLVPIEYKVQPKDVSASTQLFLKFDDETVPMEREGSEFFLTKEFSLDDYPFPTIIVEDNGVQHFEKHRYLECWALVSSCFSNYNATFSGSFQPADNFVKLNGTFYLTPSEVIADNPIISSKFIISIDGEAVECTEFKDLGDYSLDSAVDVNKKYELENGQTFEAKYVAEDAQGFIHEYKVFHFEAGSGDGLQQFHDTETIYSPDGQLVYSEEIPA